MGPAFSEETLLRIAHAYEAGDQVFLFGFSRGAYTARALAAFIAEHADTHFGTFVFDDVRLVGYRRTCVSVSLIEYGRFAFA